MIRQFVLAIIAACAACSPGFGQGMVNWDFSTNTGNCVGCALGCTNIPNIGFAPQIEEGPGFPNWHITHGSPNFPFSISDPYPDDINMYSDKSNNGQGVGEGIAGGYNFIAGKTYTIGVGLRGGADPTVFHLALVRGNMPHTLNCDADICVNGGYQGILPAVNSADIMWLSKPSYVDGNNTFTFTPSQNYNWVWIFALNPNLCNAGIRVSHVYVVRKCEEDLYLTSASIPPDYYTAFKRIHVGSGATSAMSTVSGTTTFEASETVILRNNLTIEPTGNNVVVATANMYSCDYPPVALPRPAAFAANTDDESSERANKSISGPTGYQVLFYPNPTRDFVTITLPDNNKESTVDIINMNGAVLRTQVIPGSGAYTVSLKDYPAGIYVLRLSSASGSVIEKIIKTD